MLNGRLDEGVEQGVTVPRCGLELGVKLHRDEEGMRGDLDDLPEFAVRRGAREAHALLFEQAEVILIQLVAVTVTFVD